jgi:hypothetical protein
MVFLVGGPPGAHAIRGFAHRLPKDKEIIGGAEAGMGNELVGPPCASLEAALQRPGFLHKSSEATGNGGVLLLLGQKGAHGLLKRFEGSKAIVPQFEGPLLKRRPEKGGQKKRGGDRFSFRDPRIGTFQRGFR